MCQLKTIDCQVTRVGSWPHIEISKTDFKTAMCCWELVREQQQKTDSLKADWIQMQLDLVKVGSVLSAYLHSLLNATEAVCMDSSSKNGMPSLLDSCLKACKTANDQALLIENKIASGLLITVDGDAAENWFVQHNMLNDIWPLIASEALSDHVRRLLTEIVEAAKKCCVNLDEHTMGYHHGSTTWKQKLGPESSAEQALIVASATLAKLKGNQVTQTMANLQEARAYALCWCCILPFRNHFRSKSPQSPGPSLRPRCGGDQLDSLDSRSILVLGPSPSFLLLVWS